MTLKELYALTAARPANPDARHFREIPNSLGWPTEDDGYLLSDEPIQGTSYRRLVLIAPGGDTIGTWDAGRWLTPNESRAATRTMHSVVTGTESA
jgi:hypothetical protein